MGSAMSPNLGDFLQRCLNITFGIGVEAITHRIISHRFEHSVEIVVRSYKSQPYPKM